MRALPALSLEYFGSTAEGNTALPTEAGANGEAAGASLLAVVAAGAAGAAAGVASAAHWALRKSFHFWPFSVPASLAALYFALHSCIVSAWLGAVAANAAKPATAAAHNNFARKVILGLPLRIGSWNTILAEPATPDKVATSTPLKI